MISTRLKALYNSKYDFIQKKFECEINEVCPDGKGVCTITRDCDITKLIALKIQIDCDLNDITNFIIEISGTKILNISFRLLYHLSEIKKIENYIIIILPKHLLFNKIISNDYNGAEYLGFPLVNLYFIQNYIKK